MFATGDSGLAGAPWWRNLGRRLVAEAAITDRWGDPAAWLRQAHSFFTGSAPELRARAAPCCATAAQPCPAPVPTGATRACGPRDHPA